MAYCRFSDGDVYLYAHVDGGYECCSCWMQPLGPTIFTNPSQSEMKSWKLTEPCQKCNGEFNGCKACGMHKSINLATAQEALAHLRAHREAGHDVPEYAFDSLQEEIDN